MNLIKSTGTFSFFTIISRILGYLRDILIAIFLGAGPLADAFFVAFRIPNTFRRLFSEGTFNAAFVPSYATELSNGKVILVKLIAKFILSSLPLNPGAIKNTNKGINISIIKTKKNKLKINKLNTFVANFSDCSFPFAISEA